MTTGYATWDRDGIVTEVVGFWWCSECRECTFIPDRRHLDRAAGAALDKLGGMLDRACTRAGGETDANYRHRLWRRVMASIGYVPVSGPPRCMTSITERSCFCGEALHRLPDQDLLDATALLGGFGAVVGLVRSWLDR